MLNDRKTILVVEDNVFSALILQKGLQNEGYKCIVAPDVNSALVTLDKELPDIILSDYEMPDQNGFDFREQLIGHPVLKNIPFIFLTAHTDQALMLKGLRMNAIDFISKDTPFPMLVSKVNSVLQVVRNQHELSVQELKKAADAINIKSIPKTVPCVDGYKIDFKHQSYQNYPGGDFIDFIKVDEQHTFIVLGDVMGKKWKAWYFTFGYLSYIRAAIRFSVLSGEFDTAKILSKINDLICMDEVLADIFSSLSLLMIDNKNNNIHYTGAGDLPLLHYKKENNELVKIQSSGLLLGVINNTVYESQAIKLSKDDELFIFTDGMIDSANDDGNISNYDGLMQCINNYKQSGLSFEETSNAVFNNTIIEQADDASIIFIKKI